MISGLKTKLCQGVGTQRINKINYLLHFLYVSVVLKLLLNAVDMQ